jgi:hypothetical protein
LSALDYLRITEFGGNSTSAFTLEWPAKADRTYRVFRSTALDKSNYTAVGTGIPGIEPTASFTDDSAPPEEQLFYWVEVEPQ